MKALTQKEAEERVLKICKDKNYTLIEQFIYINKHTKIYLSCNNKNHIWYTKFKNINNTCCRKCIVKSKLIYNEAKEKVLKICNEKNYTLLEPFIYNNGHTKFNLKCNNDEYKWSVSYYQLKKSGCSKCSKNLKISQEEAFENVKKLCEDKNYLLLDSFIYENNKTKIHLKCNIDNYEWYVNYISLFRKTRNAGCPKCSGNLKILQEKAEKNILNICEDKNYTLLKKFNYINNQTIIHLKCNKDNNIWYTTYSCLMQKHGCPSCGKKYNKCENKIKNILEKNNIKYIYQYKNKQILDKQILDFYLIDYNVAIEYQGKQHFCSINFFGGIDSYQKTILRDKNKFINCKNNNIKIMYFTYEKEIPNTYYDKIYTNENELIKDIFLYKSL